MQWGTGAVAGLLAVLLVWPESSSWEAIAAEALSAKDAAENTVAWWIWPLLLLVVTFIMGIIAVLGGIGGGVLYVPIISGFFPFHIDFVRSAGLLVALSGALAAGPGLLKANLASLRLAIPLALVASACAVIGAMFGLALPAHIVKLLLGITILGVAMIMFAAKKSEYPDVPQADALSTALGIYGIYHGPDRTVDWKIHRTVPALLTFIIIGIMAGMFGLGAGWANVPVLNLMLGAPLKISVAT
ncbi:MAG: sulfite exporter TauE/SafE family protein, partial [Candidatus Electrothrix sp. AUS4]|nr:sulfite exporter TauE/SafE family protein [Candidatus Electrothrix sp. AUS4]